MHEVVTIETPGLGDRSYLIHDGETAAVIDPQRDIGRVLQAAQAAGAAISHVLETHIHNDYVTGGLALARAAGAAYVVAAAEEVGFSRIAARVQDPSAPPATAEPVPAPVATPAPAVESEEPPAPQPAPSVTLQGGMTLQVRLGESLSSEHNQAGDTFTATLDAPLSAGGFVIAERGARVEGRVVEAQKSGHVKGKATLALELTNLNTSDGQHVAIKTETLRKQGTTMATGDQVGVVAAAAGVGAIIGAIAGGGKGAAIGAGAGGAAGTGGVVATRDKAVTLPTESKIAFRLSAPVTITEQLNR